MVSDGSGLDINVRGCQMGWVDFNKRELQTTGVVGVVTIRAESIDVVEKQGGAAILWVGMRPVHVHENYEEVFRRIADAVKPEIKEPMLKTPAPTPANGVSDGTVPVRKKAR